MQQFEAAIREELGISTSPPRSVEPPDFDLRGRARALLRRPSNESRVSR
jgi:hypothetical protein